MVNTFANQSRVLDATPRFFNATLVEVLVSWF